MVTRPSAAERAAVRSSEHGFGYWQTVSIPDARRSGPGIGWRERRAGPRHAAVWVRLGGRWRKGRIIEWVTVLGGEGWDCVILADELSGGPPWQGRYHYDPRAIRQRHGDTPPPESP